MASSRRLGSAADCHVWSSVRVCALAPSWRRAGIREPNQFGYKLTPTVHEVCG